MDITLLAIIFLLGVIWGSFLTVSFYIFVSYRMAKGPGPVEKIATKASRSGAKKSQKAKILEPLTPYQEAQEAIVQKNAERGEGTPLEEIT